MEGWWSNKKLMREKRMNGSTRGLGEWRRQRAHGELSKQWPMCTTVQYKHTHIGQQSDQDHDTRCNRSKWPPSHRVKYTRRLAQSKGSGRAERPRRCGAMGTSPCTALEVKCDCEMMWTLKHEKLNFVYIAGKPGKWFTIINVQCRRTLTLGWV